MKTSLYQDQNSPIREADKLLFSRNNEFSAFDWTITQLPTSPTISQHNFIPQHIIDTFNNSKGNVGYDHLLDLTNSDNISLVQKYLYDYLYLGAREAEEVYISYRD